MGNGHCGKGWPSCPASLKGHRRLIPEQLAPAVCLGCSWSRWSPTLQQRGGPVGQWLQGSSALGPACFWGTPAPLGLGARHRLEQAGAASSSPALCHWKHEKSDVKIKGTYSLLSHLFACCSLPFIYLQKCLWLLLALERMLGDKGHFLSCYHTVTELRAVVFLGALRRTFIPAV